MKTTIFLLILSIFACRHGNAQEHDLEYCIAYGLEHNRSLLASLASTTEARYGHKEQVGRLLPEINGSAGTDYYWKIPVQAFPGELVGQPAGTFVPVRMGTPWTGNFGAQATLPLVDVAKWAELRRSTLTEALKACQTELLAAELEKQITQFYFEALLAEEQVEVARRRLAQYEEIHSLLDEKASEGIIDRIALNQSSTLLNERKLQLSAAQQSEANALLSLRFCMGYPLDSSLHIQHDLFPSFSAPAAFDSTALPLYPQHNLQVAMAGQDRKARLGHLYPQLNMRAGFQQTGFGDDIGFLGSDNWFSSGYIGVQLQIPLFSLNKMHYTPARYRLHLRTLEYERQHYLQEGERNFRSEAEAIRHLQGQLLLEEENVIMATQNVSLAEEKVRLGIIDMIELRQVQSDLDRALEQQTQTRRNLLRHQLSILYLQSKSL